VDKEEEEVWEDRGR